MLELYSYQEKSIKELIELYKTGDYAYLQMPTGTGKTFTAMQLLIQLGVKKVLWLVGSVELVKQTKAIAHTGVNVMTWQYAYLHIEELDDYDFLVIDEVHFGGKSRDGTSFKKILSACEKYKRLYISASPWDLNYEMLGEIEGRVAAYYIDEAYYDGNIPDMEMHQIRAGKQAEVSEIEKQCGVDLEYLESLEDAKLTAFLRERDLDINNFHNIRSIACNRVDFLVREYIKSGGGKQAVLFTPNTSIIKYAVSVLSKYNITNNSISHLMSNTSDTISEFKSRGFSILVVCNMLNFGFDMPNLSLALDGCYSKSVSRNYQKLGRLLRKHPGKEVARYVYARDLLETDDETDMSTSADAMLILYCDRGVVVKGRDYGVEGIFTGDKASFKQVALALGGEDYGYTRFSEIIERASRQGESDIKKKRILEMAVSGAERPSVKSKNKEISNLGRALDYYASKKCIDTRFCELIRKTAPHWFISPQEKIVENKRNLIQIAKTGKDKPSKDFSNEREKQLYRSFHKYVNKECPQYDEEFTKKIKEVAPTWLITARDKVNQKKERLLQMAREGKDRPSPSSKNKDVALMAIPLKDYTNKSKGSYDQKFVAALQEIAPDWFLTPQRRAELKKQQIVKWAKDGGNRPRRRSDVKEEERLYTTFTNFTTRTSVCFDEEFVAELKRIRPDWFGRLPKIFNNKNKIRLINMAENGEGVPPRGSIYRRHLKMYISKSSHSYDEKFDEKIKTYKHWFKGD